MGEVIVKEDCDSEEGFKLHLGQILFDVDELDDTFEGFTQINDYITLVSVNKDFVEKL